MIDLESMSLEALKDLQRDVNKAVATFETRRRKEAIAALEEHAKQFGFTMAELTGVKVPRQRVSSPAKFANPANPADTWTGRGRKPKWFIEAIESGKTEADLAVQ